MNQRYQSHNARRTNWMPERNTGTIYVYLLVNVLSIYSHQLYVCQCLGSECLLNFKEINFS